MTQHVDIRVNHVRDGVAMVTDERWGFVTVLLLSTCLIGMNKLFVNVVGVSQPTVTPESIRMN